MKPTDQLSRQAQINYWQKHLDFLFDAEKIIASSRNPEVIDTTKKYMSKVTKKRMYEFKKLNANQLN